MQLRRGELRQRCALLCAAGRRCVVVPLKCAGLCATAVFVAAAFVSPSPRAQRFHLQFRHHRSLEERLQKTLPSEAAGTCQPSRNARAARPRLAAHLFSRADVAHLVHYTPFLKYKHQDVELVSQQPAHPPPCGPCECGRVAVMELEPPPLLPQHSGRERPGRLPTRRGHQNLRPGEQGEAARLAVAGGCREADSRRERRARQIDARTHESTPPRPPPPPPCHLRTSARLSSGELIDASTKEWLITSSNPTAAYRRSNFRRRRRRHGLVNGAGRHPPQLVGLGPALRAPAAATGAGR